MGPAGVNSLFYLWLMNKDSWEKLPPEAQKAIMDIQGQFEQKSLGISLEEEKISMAAAREAGHPIIELTPQELEMWMQVGEKVSLKWAEEIEAKGKAGRAVYEEAKRLIAKFNKE
jgi:TRAP-type C4-dicarboxylate transport system substrate-binding protein